MSAQLRCSQRWSSRVAVALLLLAVPGCAGRSQRSPEQLRDAYGRALEGNDAAAAYALLDPALRATLPFAEFKARWDAQSDERAAALAQLHALPAAYREPVAEGTTVHAGGRVLRWTAVDGRYYVTDGLPGAPQTATPAETIRALIVAVRTTEFTRIRRLLGDELAAALGEDWSARTDAMEAALGRPGAIELSEDLRRAELRYESDRVLTLEQTPRGWRIVGLE